MLIYVNKAIEISLNMVIAPVKGYLHYKTITPQSVLSEAQVKIFFML